jgi:hypothetical protein
MGNFLTRTKERLASSSTIEDAQLRQDAIKAGCEPIAVHQDRCVVTVHGTLRTVTLCPRSGVAPALEAELYDGSGTVLLVWLGHRRIAGITPGREITACGRLGTRGGERVMFNPRYELIA